MAKYGSGNFSSFLVDGKDLRPSLVENVSISWEVLNQQTNPFGVTSEENTPVNIYKAMLNAPGGFWDNTTDEIHTNWATDPMGVTRVVCAALFGSAIGLPFIGLSGAISGKYEVLGRRDGLTKANLTYVCTGDVDEGVIIQDLATFTADWDTKTGGANATDAPVDYTLDPGQRVIGITSSSVANPTVITTAKPHGLATGDIILIAGHTGSSPTVNGQRTVTVTGASTFTIPVNVTVAGTGGTFVRANSILGGVGYLQCTALSGFTGVVMKIMHSPDDITYAALVTFTTLTAAGRERKTVSGTVDRYLSSNGDVTGSGSVTVFSGFARNV